MAHDEIELVAMHHQRGSTVSGLMQGMIGDLDTDETGSQEVPQELVLETPPVDDIAYR